MDNTKISWTHASWNPQVGCSRVSAGCQNCYAEVAVSRIPKRLNGAQVRGAEFYEGITRETSSGPRWTGVIKPKREVLDQPLRWKRPRKIFVNSLSDLFHENLPFSYVGAVFGVMLAAKHHTFQVLTKRPKRAAEFFVWLDRMAIETGDHWTRCCLNLAEVELPDNSPHKGTVVARGEAVHTSWPIPNVWLGVSVEDQKAADERIPILLRLPAAVRFLSCEPLLGPVDLEPFFGQPDKNGELSGPRLEPDGTPAIKWTIVGGESGPNFRPMDVSWAQAIQAQCEEAGVAFFYKQAAAYKPGQNPHLPGKDGQPTKFQAFPV